VELAILNPMASPTILVADDDQPLVQLLKENLEMEGYQVITGTDGEMAVTLATTRQPNLMILDINMPFTNGFDVLTHLRKMPETQSIPVIFITGIQSKTLYPIIDRHERVAYIKKPFDLDHLNSLVQEFLQKYPVQKTSTPALPATPSEAPISFPPIEKFR